MIYTRAGNLCTREYSQLFVARFSLQATRELYTLYTHNTWVVWSKTNTKTKKSQKRLIASTQVPSSNFHVRFCHVNLYSSIVFIPGSLWRPLVVPDWRGEAAEYKRSQWLFGCRSRKWWQLKEADMEFVKNFTPSDFQVRNFTPTFSPNFNSFSKKKTQKMEKFTPLAKVLHCRRHWRDGQIPPLTYRWQWNVLYSHSFFSQGRISSAGWDSST